MKGIDELKEREVQWRTELMGTLGPALERAPKPILPKLLQVENTKVPFEPLESEELVQKFTRARDEEFYDKLSYVEREQKKFETLQIEPVSLKPGKIEKYEPPKEELEKVNLRGVQPPEEVKDPKRFKSPPPDWAAGQVKLGQPAGKVTQREAPAPEVNIPARDQVKFRAAKPKPVAELPDQSRFKIAEDKAKLKQVQQGPEIEKEQVIPAKDQVQIRKTFEPQEVKQFEKVKVEAEPLKSTPEVVKKELEKTTISNKVGLNFFLTSIKV